MEELLVIFESWCFRVVLGLVLFFSLSALLSSLWGAPWVPSSMRTTRKMLAMADLKPGEKLIDLGAGDGRIVIVAAREYRAQAVGVEIDPLRCFFANLVIRILGLQHLARVQYGSMFDFDLEGADVVSLYLLQGTNQQLKQKLAEELKPGARVVSHSFTLVGWIPAAIDDRGRIFLYKIGSTDAVGSTRFV